MIQSRCGILCAECKFHIDKTCNTCTKIEKPFWAEDICPVKYCCEQKEHRHCGQCASFPCELALSFAYHEAQGDDGKRIKQCREWSRIEHEQ